MTRLFMTKLLSWPASRPVSGFTLPLLFALAILIFGLNSAFAEKPEKKIDWYQVEVIIFSQQDLFNEERPRKDIELTFPENIRQLLTLDTAPVKAAEQTAFSTLPESAMSMVPDRNRLKRAPGYRVLFHKAWRQPGLGRKQSPWIFIQGGNKTNERHELEGSFRLVRNRYLHVQANLWKAKLLPSGTQFNQPVTLSSGISNGETGSLQTQYLGNTTYTNAEEDKWPNLPELPIFQAEHGNAERTTEGTTQGTTQGTIGSPTIAENPPLKLASNPSVSKIVVLDQSTRVTRNELTYLDHPNMGVIALITKYEPEESPTKDNIETTNN